MREIDRQSRPGPEPGVIPGALRIGVDLDGVISTLFPGIRKELLVEGIDIYRIISQHQRNRLPIAYDIRDWPEIKAAGLLEKVNQMADD